MPRSRISLELMKLCRIARSACVVCVALFCAVGLIVPGSAGAGTGQRHGRPSKSRAGRVQTGLDVLEAEKFAPLRGKHVGLITNHTGIDFQERSVVELLAHAPGVQLVALFSPEHGIAGHADEKLPSTKDASTGLPIYSLYGEHLRPTD